MEPQLTKLLQLVENEYSRYKNKFICERSDNYFTINWTVNSMNYKTHVRQRSYVNSFSLYKRPYYIDYSVWKNCLLYGLAFLLTFNKNFTFPVCRLQRI